MNVIPAVKWFSVGGALLLFLAAQTLAATPQQTQYSDAIDAQTRGPVHEAFAEPIELNPEPGITVSQPPPNPIDEQPPDMRPEDENAVWIPGYWGWDEDRDNFLWISGVWRVPPPGYSWVPGYWTQVGNGYQWVPGFWTPVQTQEINYLPSPPESLEAGPSSPAPSADDFWVPGVWSWQATKYVWRPGYWMPGRDQWMWTPAHYVWTPRGVVFVDGHWDYTLDNRGVLFAPVYFQQPVYTQPSFVYTPSLVIDAATLTSNLFTWPRYNHYYFGDYYAPVYERRGIRPWFEFAGERRGYDPIYTYRHWRYGRTNPRWVDEVRSEYRRRVVNSDLRPPRTYRDLVRQQNRLERLPVSERRTMLFAHPLQDVVRNRELATRWQPVKPDSRRQFIQQENDLRKFGSQRSRWEIQGRRPQIGVTPAQRKPETVRIPSLVVRPRSVQPETRRPATVTPRPESPRPLAPRTPVTPRPQPRVTVPPTTPTPGRPVITPRPQQTPTQRSTTVRPLGRPEAKPPVTRTPAEPSRPELREYRRAPFTPSVRPPSVAQRPQPAPSTVVPSDRSRFQMPRVERTPAVPMQRPITRSPSVQPAPSFQAPRSFRPSPAPEIRSRPSYTPPSMSPRPMPQARPNIVQPHSLGRPDGGSGTQEGRRPR